MQGAILRKPSCETDSNLAKKFPQPGQCLEFWSHEKHGQLIFFAESDAQVNYYLDAFLNNKWVAKYAGNFVITPYGWGHIRDHMKGVASPSNPALVAMWFDSKREGKVDMERVFRAGLLPGAGDAGYRALRVDFDNRNNDGVMDEVIARIREAPFVIADFTGNRNGVYFEAGYARGLGKPVIHSCHVDDFNAAHFDIQHINTICWSDVDELRRRIANRILGNLPRGPHPVNSPSH